MSAVTAASTPVHPTPDMSAFRGAVEEAALAMLAFHRALKPACLAERRLLRADRRSLRNSNYPRTVLHGRHSRVAR